MTATEIITQPARIEHAKEIVYFHQALAEYCGTDSADVHITQDMVEKIIVSPESLAIYTVAEVYDELGKKALAGMVQFGEMPTVGWNGASRFYVEDLYVKEQFRGQNIGHWLMAAVGREVLRRVGDPDRASISLDTMRHNNDPTLRFYDQLGFERHNYNLRLSGSRVVDLAHWGTETPGFSGTLDW